MTQKVKYLVTALENIIPDTKPLVEKTDYDAKIWDIENKYFTRSYYNKFTKDIVANSIKSKELLIYYCWIHKQCWFRQKKIKVGALATRTELKSEQETR